MDIKEDRILIIDFGSQFTQLIARRVREHKVYCEIWPYNKDITHITNFKPKALILSGGPASVIDGNAPKISNDIFKLNIPILGICYGQQILCQQLGGQVENSTFREFGRAELTLTNHCALFSDEWSHKKFHVWMSHGDRIVTLPEGFKAIATSSHSPYAIIANEQKKIYGIQFHPEVVHTEYGSDLIKNFLYKIAQCKGSWTINELHKQLILNLQHQIGHEKVICGLSGGVDSAVTAVLLHEAIRDNLTCIFVNNGLLREGEAEEVISLFRQHYNISLIYKDASDLFINALKSIEDPEIKRKTIGRLFIEIFEEEAKKLGNVKFLAQGTLYPDIIESQSAQGGPSVTIKSHHNVGGLPEKMNMSLVEPLKDLFKDEVRHLGQIIGLPKDFIKRHPFPGPGLAIRIIGPITLDRLSILRKADKIFISLLKEFHLYDKIWQAFVVLLPVKTVGVMGDSRSYDYVCALRAITSTDGMTADSYPFDHSFLTLVSTRIINEVKGINRVTYDITSKPPATIEWE
ncbi:MAG: glutamine-hydrolyzing GMP synthase [Alphaproteobacteria bacterium]|nr:glutamine-hydrolyzing GMP synthase [Alphaproteobacteria bacterium]